MRRPLFFALLLAGIAAYLIWLPPRARLGLARTLRSHREILGLASLFGLIAVSLVWSAGQRLDAQLFLLFNLGGRRPRWLDRLMWWLTQLGSMPAAILLAAILLAMGIRRLSVEVGLGTLTLWLVVELLKVLTDRARPFHVLEGARVVGWNEPGRSFPSGHTSQVFFLVALLCVKFEPSIATVVGLYLLAAVVGYTRVFVGAHYPRDVMGGAMLGSVWGFVANVVDMHWIGLGRR